MHGSPTTFPVPRRHARARICVLVAIGALALWSISSASAGGTTKSASWTPQQILAAANGERKQQGLPPVGLRADWSAKCAKHVSWIATNRTLAHAETPGSPGYSSDGHWAGTHAILAMGAPWSNGNPFLAAPIHLNQMMAPQLRSIGAWEDSGTSCLTTWPGMTFAGSFEPRFYSWPGDDARNVPPAVTAAELPFIPGQFVGLPQGTTTGPNMMVYAVGWDRVRIVSASVTPDGGTLLETRLIDRSHRAIGPYLVPGSGFVIPTRPLLPATRYTVSVQIRNLGTGVTRSTTWSFTTAEAVPPTAG